MRRPIRKGIAFFLALTLFLGSWNSVAFAADSSKTDENAVSVLAETIYDEAVTFSEHIVMLENGNWANGNDKNATKNTKIVFMDEDGNKKVISNKTKSGSTLFDAVYPYISDSGSMNVLTVVKNGKVSFIQEDGTYFGKSLVYYHYARPLSGEFILVSNDEVTYRVIDGNGKVVLDNLANKWVSVYAIGKYVYAMADGKTYVLNEAHDIVKTYNQSVYISSLADGYFSVKTQDALYVLNPEGEVFKTLATSSHSINTQYVKDGYLIYGDTVITKSEYGYNVYNYYYYIVDVKTDKVLYTSTSYITFDGKIILGQPEKGVNSVSDIDGTVYIKDLDKHITNLGKENGYKEITYDTYYVDGNILISILDMTDASKIETFVYTQDDDYKEYSAKVGGYYSTCAYGKEETYFMTCDSEWYLKNMCTIDGKVIKTFADKSYRGAWSIADIEGGTADFAFAVSIYKDGQWAGNAYLMGTGKISKTYRSVGGSGNFLIAQDNDNNVNIINADNTVIYKGDITKISYTIYSIRDCFVITKNGRCYLYDRDGKVIFGKDSAYTGIGDGTGTGGSYEGGADGIVTYDYSNYPILDGIFVVRKEVNGKNKYGVIKLAKDGFYKAPDGNWYYYKDGNVDKTYTGMAKNQSGWWYVKNGKLDKSYTGMVKKGSTWMYVKKGKWDSSYTGMVKKDSTWWYIKDGKFDKTYTGMSKAGSTWIYVKNGKYDTSYTGMVKKGSSWMYVKKGKWAKSYTGTVKKDSTWWYIKDGKFDKTYTGMAKAGSTWIYLKNGKYATTYTGMVKKGSSWMYVKNGKWAKSYTGMVKKDSTWWYINDGKFDKTFKGIAKAGSTKIFVKNGKMDRTYTGKFKYNGKTYTIKKGKVVK